jgi:hypothetical protein
MFVRARTWISNVICRCLFRVRRVQLRLDVIVGFVDIGWLDHHHCLNLQCQIWQMGRLFKLYLNSLIMSKLLKRSRENVWYTVNIYFNNVFFYSIGSEPINIHLKSDGHLQCEKLMQNRIFKSDLKRASSLLFFYTIIYILQYLCSTFDMVLKLFLFTFYGKQSVVIKTTFKLPIPQQFTLIS